jgi:hypothetical protein
MFVRVWVPGGQAITRVGTVVHTVAATDSPYAENGFAIYTDEGELVSSTPFDATLWRTVGYRKKDLTTPIPAEDEGRFVYVAITVQGDAPQVPYAVVEAPALYEQEGQSRRGFGRSGLDAWPASIDPATYGNDLAGYLPFLYLENDDGTADVSGSLSVVPGPIGLTGPAGPAGAAGAGITTEEVQDVVGGMVSSNTETRVALTYDDAGGKINAVVDAFPVVLQFAFDGALTTGTGTRRVYNPTGRTITIKQVTAHVVTAPTGAAILLDVNIGGTTVFTTQGNRPSIAASGNTSTAGNSDAAASTLASGGYLTVDVDQIGSTVAGSDLTGVIYGEI